MSLYHIVFVLIIAGAVWEHIKGKTPKYYFWISFLIIAGMLCIRFGQGQDYFSYASIYHAVPANVLEAFNSQVHSEPGWKVICSLFRCAGVQFPGFVLVVSLYISFFFLRFLRLYGGERKMLALVLSYHTLYMSYFASALRQGIVIATMLGLLLPWFLDKKYIRYCIVVYALSLIHSVALVLLLLPVLKGIRIKVSQLVALVPLGFLIGVALSLIDVEKILFRIVPHVYLLESEISLVAILERISTFAVVTFCFYTYHDGLEPEANDDTLALYKIYAVGIFVYGILIWSALISSRTVYVLKVLEIVLLCVCIIRCKKATDIVLCYCLLLSFAMYVKNIGSYIDQGAYQNTTIIDYPFVTVFNKHDILNYRQNTVDYPFY